MQNLLKSFCVLLLLLLHSTLSSADNSIKVQILSATVKDQKIEGATLILQKNGEQSITANSDTNGIAHLASQLADDNSALLIIKKAGYSNLVVKCPCTGMTYAISPIMKQLDSLRIVLNWGIAPSDIDSHILYPNNHIYYVDKTGTDAWLDVDDTDSYGPETITIDRRHEGERYVYAVHDFSNKDNVNNTALSVSAAKVFVYVGQTLVRTYYVPQNKIGNLWTVFAITEQGDFQDINTMTSVASSDRLQTSEFQGVIETTAVETIIYSDTEQHSATELNSLGEHAYHAGNYSEAIDYYQQAINLYGNYGQAYSNLGLAFQKAGNVAEALWANRKAIALATGANAATIRASSHYNNGKIYETAEQWSDALREYHYAKREKQNEVYDKAILRMQKHGAR